MKRKLVAALLATTMMMGMSVTAFAADTVTSPQEDLTVPSNTSITVQGVYSQDVTTSDPVYNVDVKWENMSFTYEEAGTKTWNPDTHKYDYSANEQESGWVDNTGVVTVINNSNADVEAELEFTKDAGVDAGINVQLNGSSEKYSQVLTAATEGMTEEQLSKAVVNVTVSGGKLAADQALGTVKVTLSKTTQATE